MKIAPKSNYRVLFTLITMGLVLLTTMSPVWAARIERQKDQLADKTGLRSKRPVKRAARIVPGEIIVKLKSGHSDTLGLSRDAALQGQQSRLQQLEAQHSLQTQRPVYNRIHRLQKQRQDHQIDTAPVRPVKTDLSSVYLVKTGRDVQTVCAELAADPEVEYAQPNYSYRICREPNDAEFLDQYAHQVIQMADAWDISIGSRDIVVAVLDTGVDVNHPDLNENIWVNPGEIPDNDIDDDENGYIDDIHGWNFDGDNNRVSPIDDPDAILSSVSGHGTMVSGVIAGVGNNGIGVAGVNWECSIMALRLSDLITSEEVAVALDYAAANGARIANMSFGADEFGPKGDGLVMEAIDRAYVAGVLLVASAGNSDNAIPQYPAAYPTVMAVASTDGEDIKTGHSSFGPWVDIAAPGTDIVTTDMGEDGEYIAIAGTSFSGPYVAAVGALVLSLDPSLSHLDVRAILENTTDPVYYGDLDPALGYIGTGRVNAYRALQEADRPLPLGEIAQPRMRQTLPNDGNDVELALLMQGESYIVEYSSYGHDDWYPIRDGEVATDANCLVRLTLANPGAGTYTLRLTVTGDGTAHTDVKDFGIDALSRQSHWPKEEEAKLPPETYYNGSPLCVDFDGNGSNEIIQSTISMDFDDYTYGDLLGEIAIWDKEGHALPGWPQEFLTDFTSIVMTGVGDIDGDGAFELVVVDDYYLTVTAFEITGELVEGLWPIDVGPWWAYISSDPVLADLDQDGDSEIIVALDAESSTEDGLFAIQGDGSYLWERRYISHGPLSVADMDGDGDVEIALSGLGPGISNVHTFLLDHQGQQIKRWRGGGLKGTVISDLDGDGEKELLFCTDTYVQAVHIDGRTVWRTKVSEPLDTAGGMSIGDLDGDGKREVYVTSLVEGDGFGYTQVYGFDHAGRELDQQGFPKVLMGDSFRTIPLIADVDGDGARELLVAAGGAPTIAWEADGSVTPGFPLLDPLHDFYTVPAIEDLDQDGDLDFMLLGNDSRLHVFDLASPSLPGSVDWGHVRHDPQNTGWSAPPLEINAIEAPSQVSPGERLLIQPKISDSGTSSLQYTSGGLPEGAFYDDDTHTVIWKPTADQAFHTYDISFLVTDGIRQDSRKLSVTVTPGSIYHADMNTDPNWILDEGWAWGVPSGAGSWNGDPNTGHIGENVLGYEPEGDYQNLITEPHYATTGAIDCTGYRDIRLSFWRWLGLESPYDQASVQVSNDGVNWVDLWTSGHFHISDDTWQYVDYAMPTDVGDNQSTVFIRWGLGPTDESVTYPGWNIDDVQVIGQPIN